jgi:thiamine kinase-like enzyme
MGKLIDRVADPAIPTLAAVLAPARLSRELSNVLPNWELDGSQEVRFRVLKWQKASRCTLEIMLPTTSGYQELIGKVYAEDRSDIYQVMEEIRRAGFGSEEEFSIARPLAYLASLRLLLSEKIPGIRARSLIVDPNTSDRIPAVERCARWLARFQARAPRSGPVFRLEDCLIAWEGWLQGFADLDSPFAHKARRLLAQLKATAPGRDGVERCASHGDYTCSQVLLFDGRAVTIDWDTFNLTDPSYDVARFLVDLKRMGIKYFGSIHALDWAADLFLKTYSAAGGAYHTTHLSFHQAGICLERAKSDVDRQLPGWGEWAEMMLDEGLRILDYTPN